ncbi:hypothetical protein LVJ82_06980 [Vitreoscilla massiliensis]|uniref:Uncharacterized protein n=1 Tax=Vitreoscilla massiliensis TaxID=1689272 RepID=A0ABY4E5E3_9NEIS|nr:hypothetical protein [Vitreoscilla massiliensis]UOO90704.1 hypothetical protein LVJ82_06980 [Vitreoscilla massiliensis]
MNKNQILHNLKDNLAIIFADRIKEEKLTFNGDSNNYVQVALRWLDYNFRYIKQRPRKIYYTQSFPNKLKFHTERALIGFIRQAQYGLNINPYLSNTLKTNDTSNARSQQRTDKFLAHFGIHHFHLPTANFNNTSDFLNSRKNNCWLFAIVSDEWIGLIDILPHDSGNFYNFSLLESIYDSWPGILEPYRLKNVRELTHDICSVDSVKLLRNADINTPLLIRNNYYMSPFGVSGSGTNSITTGMFIDINELLNNLATSLMEPNSLITQEIQFKYSQGSKLKLTMCDDKLCLSYGRKILDLTYLKPYNKLHQIIKLC